MLVSGPHVYRDQAQAMFVYAAVLLCLHVCVCLWRSMSGMQSRHPSGRSAGAERWSVALQERL